MNVSNAGKVCFSVVVLLLTGCGGGGNNVGNKSSSELNHPPIVSMPNEDQTVYSGISFEYDANAGGGAFSDPDGDPLTIKVEITPYVSGLNVNAGIISGAVDQPGTIQVNVIAVDPLGATATDTFNLSVREPVKVASSCPLASSSDVAINNPVVLTFDSALDMTSVPNGALSLLCDGVAVTGTTERLGENTLRFTPAEVLPVQAKCEVSVESALRSVEGAPVVLTEHHFTTGEKESFVWTAVNEFRLIEHSIPVGSQELFPYFASGMMLKSGSKFVWVFNSESDFQVAVLEEDGSKVMLSDPLLPDSFDGFSKEDLRATVDDQNLHLVFRSQIGLEGNTFEVLYQRVDLATLQPSPVYLISYPENLLSAFSPDVAVSADGVYVVWQEQPCLGCESAVVDPTGVYYAKLDFSGDPTSEVFWVGEDLENPRITAANEKIYITWAHSFSGSYADYEIEMFSPENLMIASVKRFPVDYQVLPMDLLNFQDEKVSYTWRGYAIGGLGAVETAIFSSEGDVEVAPTTFVETDSENRIMCHSVGTDGEGIIAALQVTGPNFAPVSERNFTLKLSSDGGETYAENADFKYPEESIRFCPQVGVGRDGSIWVGRLHQPKDTGKRYIMVERMQPKPECFGE